MPAALILTILLLKRADSQFFELILKTIVASHILSSDILLILFFTQKKGLITAGSNGFNVDTQMHVKNCEPILQYVSCQFPNLESRQKHNCYAHHCPPSEGCLSELTDEYFIV